MRILNAGDKIGRYEIIAKVGEGGMSIVFEAFDPMLERYVAIKLIKIESFPANLVDTVKERFVREAKALAQLNHPNIVKVHDFGEFEDAPYLVMAYLEGPTYKAIRKPIPLETAVDLIKPVADALAYIHGKGLLHRDIKASNIILMDGNHPMLTDFGIAKWIEAKDDQPTLTGHGFGLGTPEYMSPEQGMGEAVDHRSDQYSLAIVFYELITGRRPYTAGSVVAVLVKQANEPVPDPRQFVPELSESVVKFFDIALAKNIGERHADMKTFLLDLEELKLQAQTNRAKGGTPYQVETDERATSELSTGSSVKISKMDMRKVRAGEGVKPEPITLEKIPRATNSAKPILGDGEKIAPAEEAALKLVRPEIAQMNEAKPEPVSAKKKKVLGGNAPDKAQRKPVWIGSILAFVVLIGIAWGLIGGRGNKDNVEIRVVTATFDKGVAIPMETETLAPTNTIQVIVIDTLAPTSTATATETVTLTTTPTWTLRPTDTGQPTATATIAPTNTPQPTKAWSDAFVARVAKGSVIDPNNNGKYLYTQFTFTIDPGTTDITGQKFAICNEMFRGKCETLKGKLYCGVIPPRWGTVGRCLSLYLDEDLKTCEFGNHALPIFEGCLGEKDWEYMLNPWW